MFSFKCWRALLAGAVIGMGGLLSSSVLAQSVSLQPPSISLIDRNGVDLVGGTLSINIPGISAGSGGSGISRSGSGYNLPFGDNFTGVLNGSATGTLSVTLGGSTEKFTWNGSALVSSTGSLNTMSCASNICTYTLADGTVATFDQTLVANIGIQSSAGAVTQITKPDGEVLKFYYKTANTYVSGLGQYLYFMGLRAVTSSLGWMVKYEVGISGYSITPTKIYIINTSVDYCDPTLDGPCADMSHSATWPTMVIGGSGSTATYTQILNASAQTGPVSTLTTSTVGSPISTTYATGITSPTGVVESATFTGTVVNTVTSGGQIWFYSHGTGTTTVTDPMGGQRIVTFSPSTSQVLSDQDEMGRVTKYSYDTSGRITQIIHPDATYSGSTLLGGYTQYTYDTAGHLTDITEYGKDGTSILMSHAVYPTSGCNTKTCNKPTSVTVPATVSGTPATITTTYTYDSSGNLLTETRPAVGGIAPQIRYSYSQITPYNKETSGNPGTLAADLPVWRLTQKSTCMSTSSCTNGADEARTTIAYANNNVLPTSVTASVGDGSASVTTTTSYDGMGNVTSVDGPISGTDDAAYAFYDLLNRRIGQIGQKNGASTRAATQIAYNNSGQVTSTTNGSTTGTDATALAGMTVLDGTTTSYDGTTGLATAAVYNFGSGGLTQNISETSYDSLFRPLCTVLRMNGTTNGNACITTSGSNSDRITKTTYNAASQVLSTISAYGTANARQDFVKTYNSNGTLSTVADDKGQTTGYTYDTYNRVIKTCYPDKTTVLVVSNDCQQTGYTGAVVTAITLRDGTVENVGYDAVGRLSARSATGISESINYNNFGQITSHTNNGLTETYSYHPLWGMLSDAQPMGSVTYNYDAYGRRSQLNYPAYGGAAFNVTYGYRTDSSIQTQSVAYNGGASTVQASFGVDNFGRLNSIASGPSSVRRQREWA